MISSIEHQKSLLMLALENDHVLLSNEIRKEAVAIRQGVERIQKDVEDVVRGVSTSELQQKGMVPIISQFPPSIFFNNIVQYPDKS